MSMIDRLRELEAKATPGPWVFDSNGYVCWDNPDFGFDYVELDGLNNAALIASMRSALPLLLRVAEAADRMTPGADDWHWSDSMRDELHAAVRALRSEP